MGANESQAFVTIAQDPYPPLNNSPNMDHAGQMGHGCMSANNAAAGNNAQINPNLSAINSAFQLNIMSEPLDVAAMSNGVYMQMQQQQQQQQQQQMYNSTETNQVATASGVNVYQNLKKEYISSEADDNAKNNFFQYKSMNFHAAQAPNRFQAVNYAKRSSAAISANGTLNGMNMKAVYSNRMFAASGGMDAGAKQMDDDDEDSKNIGLIKSRLLLAGSEADKEAFFDANL
jgi:preprotein translocase subunit YajC